MFKFLFGITSSLFKGVYYLLLPLILVRVLSRRRESLLRRLLRSSYHLYAALFKWAAPYVDVLLGVDILDGFPRVFTSVALSLGIGFCLLSILHLHLGFWTGTVLVLHGLFVGRQWEGIEAPKDFQMGARIDE
ncbi:MAG: hypothetical protein PWQ55_1477 [Chloroflexota bacterium]|nr:hypothetical protein [Chloroflexota bacterium]